MTARFRQHAHVWREIGAVTDADAAELIRRDGIDILVDLAGHTFGNRLLLFARRPAPVQVTYLGYCDTTGMNAIDYRLTDALADPPGTTERLHTERLVRLPDCAWCFRPPEGAPPVSPPPFERTGGITFGCFSAIPKLTEEALRLWSRILLAVPRSRLLLKNVAFREVATQSRIRALLESAGIAADRIELLGPTPDIAGHLATYGHVDIALDTFPYHGTTTTCEALWMGVPVITLAESAHASRVGVSRLTHAGLPEFIAADQDDYARIAVQLAADTNRLADLRSHLRSRMAASPLMDAPRFAQNVEAAYREMWRKWCAEEK
jgi:predicted O-linked N-acetylglucosamine transferase (SPINDLY family)